MMQNILNLRVRGFRVIDLAALALVLVLAGVVYGGKTFAGRERSNISSVEMKISDEHKRIRLLQAEIAYLEQPSRIRRLAEQYLGMKPVDAHREAEPAALSEIAVRGAPQQP